MTENIFKNTRKQLETAEIPDAPFRFILKMTYPYKGWAFLAISSVIIAAGIGQGSIYIFKLIIDSAEAGQESKVLFFALSYPAILLLSQLFYRLSGFFGMEWTISTKKLANDTLTEYLLRHGHSYYSNRFSGSLMSKVSNVVGAIEGFIPDLLWTYVTAAVSFIVATFFMWKADVRSALIFIALAVVLIVVNKFFAKKKRELAYRNSELGTKLRGIIIDIFSNIGATRQYVRTRDEVERVEATSEEHRIASRKNWGLTEIMLTVNSFILFVFSVGIFYFLVGNWQQGNITTGYFVLIMAQFAQIMSTLLFIGRAFNNTARSFGEVSEGLDEILLPYEIIDKKRAQTLTVTRGEIVWKDIQFGYEESAVFRNFNLIIKSGERIGLVGSSGAGKTTFVSLLLRQHELTRGAITIDGQDIAYVTQDSLRENIAVVPQEPMLFHRSIRENIAYGKPDAMIEEIIAVAKKAQAHEFVNALTHGYDTLVGERGVKLSGGQKQRIAIARAMLKNAPILVLDEATSALDSESEVAIQKALHELMEGKTVIAIAHRLSTLREMDRIIVLENGHIVEDGTHDELTQNGGLYARLWEHQAGGFLQE